MLAAIFHAVAPEAELFFKDCRLPEYEGDFRMTKTIGNEVHTSSALRSSDRPQLKPIGVIRSRLKERSKAPKQGSEGAPDAWLDVYPFAAQALDGLAVGDEIIILTWFHRAHRDVLKVRPRSDMNRPLTGVFATRSPDRPNPIGLHQVTVRKFTKNRLRIGPIEAVDGTPVVDIKPVL
jgi:tRNA-Thr(GGU) m(6)t(6)A37 methyltransferase TsaA